MDHPNTYCSRKLNNLEWNYSKMEREALRMVFTLQKSWHYLLANPFVFYTDHQALKYLVNKPLHHGIICRWLMLFQESVFEFIVRLGKENFRPNHFVKNRHRRRTVWNRRRFTRFPYISSWSHIFWSSINCSISRGRSISKTYGR